MLRVPGFSVPLPPRSKRSDAAALHAPAQKADGAGAGLGEVFRRHRSQPIERVIALIDPVLRGWVNYFAVGHSSECFSFIKDWVERRSGAIWRMLRNERASPGNDGIGGGCTTL